MKQIVIILLFLLASATMIAQEVHVSQLYANPGDTVKVSVTGLHFKYMVALGLWLQWDKNQLEYLGAHNFYLPFYNEKIDTTRVLMVNHNDSTFMLAWDDVNEHNVALEDSIKIFDIVFVYKGGNANINFDTSQTVFYIEKTKKGEVALPDTLYNGFIKDKSIQGIKEARSETFSIYPNPVMNSLTINPSQNTIIKTIKIFSITGVELYNKKINNNENTTLNTSSFGAGVYLLQVFTDEGEIVKKLIKY